MTATFGAEVRHCDLDPKSGGGNGLWLPIDCQGTPAATLGSLVSQNATGPLRLGFGAWRDLLLGLQFYNGRDELITAGGRTVKNVAGYDLTKFMVGQGNTLGRIVTLTTRVYRKPELALLAEFSPDIHFVPRLLTSSSRPQWLILSPTALYCGYLGDQRAIDYHQSQLPSLNARRMVRQTFADDAQWRCEHWSIAGHGELSVRASIPPMRIQEFAAKAQLVDWVADAAFGIVLASVRRQSIALIGRAALEFGGRCWFRDRSAESRLIHFTATESERAILARLKLEFDPALQMAEIPAAN